MRARTYCGAAAVGVARAGVVGVGVAGAGAASPLVADAAARIAASSALSFQNVVEESWPKFRSAII
jgi:hypothetical protein